ncbi:MAG TPA: glycine cleavage T C-terminal barrel domain-containing protein [Acidimicrobiales bacterium]|nr:glycine cleavage T C-terminal barrel domain-containing protein [Acidimicrobiales bacterium]
MDVGRVNAVVVDEERREQERALTEAAGVVLRKLDVVEVTGEDAVKFLDGQLSQAVASIPPGGSAWSFVLQPQGKVVALVRVSVISANEVWLDCDAGLGEILVERLNRFRLRVKANLSHRTADAVSVRGPESQGLARPQGALDSLWPSWPGWDVLGSAECPAGVPTCSLEAWETVRIRAGLPVNGSDLTDKTIPAESGLVPLAASMTKGCYVGQELVARIDSRGHVNRHLRTLDLQGSVPPMGAELVAADAAGAYKTVGTITSSSFSHLAGHAIALAYVRREVDSGSMVTVRWADGETKASVN